MADYKIWNRVQGPKLKVKDKHVARKVRSIMKPFILSDDVIYRIKDSFLREMTVGLSQSRISNLPMTVTFVTERITEADGDYVAICAHAQSFSITLVKLKPHALPEIQRKDYEIDASVFSLSYKKIYEVFADCMKDFFYEFRLCGAVIPVGFCSSLPMRHFSLDTAIIPYFGEHFDLNPCQTDVKSYFEQILCRYNYQGNNQCKSASVSSITLSLPSEGSNSSSGIHHAQFDAKLLGCESVLGLDINPETCHKLLSKLKVFLDTGKPLKDIVLGISPTGVRMQDKGLEDVLHHHLLNKISLITQDFDNSHVFGYVYGDYVKGHQFFGFAAVCESTQVILFLQETFLLEIMLKKKEELNMKASQVFITLKNFLSIAQDLKTKEREIPSTLKKRVHMVENIFWWLEGCSGDVTPTCLESEESTLNVRIQELYATAVTMKLIEREQEEEAQIRKAKAAKRHLRKKKIQVDVKRTDDSPTEKKASGPIQTKVSQILQTYADDFRSALEERRIKLEFLKEKRKLINDDITDESNREAMRFLEKLCCDVHQEMEIEINYVKERIESLVFTENLERINIEPKEPAISLGSKQFLKSVQIKPKENIFEEFSLPVSEGTSEISEVLNKIRMCKEYFLNALKTRKEEVNELSYFISGLHFREDRLPSEETAAVILSRRLLVTAAKMHLREIINIESNLSKLSDAENQIVFAVPDVLQYCKDIYDLTLPRLEKRCDILQEIMSKVPNAFDITDSHLQICKELYQDLINLKETEILDIEGNISKLNEREYFVDNNVSSLCFKLFKDAIASRKKEFDVLVNNLDLLEATEVEDYDNEGIELISNCKDVFLTSIVIREKEVKILENEMKKGFDFSTLQDSQILVNLKDIFYAALELEKQRYEKLLLNKENGDNNKDEASALFVLLVTFHVS
ncbi:hypothetical protein AVEN_98780-1 [Araneus ventricosus]|uniref:hexokinase n=1 Tax=Araneus ventricosus TaxID=182803 RepID=A0A4Y2LB48_ARAVE|nr:hypothetical protein AVEN_98780-1 [Araneus ventricosus]